MINKKFTKIFLITLTLFSAFKANADWSPSIGVDDGDGSGYWGPAFCNTKPSNFTGICTATPDEFSFTIVQFRLRKMSDKSFVNLASAPQSFDFASASAGASLGSFVSGAAVPAGVYDALSFVAEGNATIRGGGYY